MAAFTAPFGAGIAYGGLVPSAGLNAINTDLPKAPNFVDGGATYTLAAANTIAGAGLFISGTGWRLLAASQVNNYGGSFVGQAAIAGLTATGGAGASGVTATGGAAAPGITATGGAFGTGAVIVAGAGGGTGLTATGTGTGGGVIATGASSGAGLTATGGGTGKGIVCNGGASTAAAIDIGTGNAIFTGSAPAATADPGQNGYVCKANIVQVRATVQSDGAGGTVLGGFGIDSLSADANGMTVTFHRAFADAAEFTATVSNNSANPIFCVTGARTTTSIVIRWYNLSGVIQNPTSSVLDACLIVSGRQ